MQSSRHFAISLAVGVALAVGLGISDPLAAAGVVGYAGALGVLIDLDHFVLARWNTGSWRAARAVLRDPATVVTDQDDIFEPGEVGPLRRLLSHVVLIGVLVPGTWLLAPALGVVTAVVLYAHVLADLVADVRNPAAYRQTADGLVGRDIGRGDRPPDADP